MKVTAILNRVYAMKHIFLVTPDPVFSLFCDHNICMCHFCFEKYIAKMNRYTVYKI